MDDERRLIFGWAHIARKADGSLPYDSQGDVVDTPEALKAWEDRFYDFLPESPTADDMHEEFGVAKIVGGLCFTPEVTKALGIPDGIIPTGQFIVVRVPNTPRGDTLWDEAKSMQKPAFSIVAAVRRVPLAEAA